MFQDGLTWQIATVMDDVEPIHFFMACGEQEDFFATGGACDQDLCLRH